MGMIAALGGANIDLVVGMAGIPGRGETVLGTKHSSMSREQEGESSGRSSSACVATPPRRSGVAYRRTRSLSPQALTRPSTANTS